MQYLADNPHTRTIYLHLDNDEPGLASADAIATALYERHTVHIVLPEIGKDINDWLFDKRQLFYPETVELNERRIVRRARKIQYKVERIS